MSIDVFDFGDAYADRYLVVFTGKKDAMLWHMSADAHMPNGVCYFAGRDRRNFRPQRAAAVDCVPIGVVRLIAHIVEKDMHHE